MKDAVEQVQALPRRVEQGDHVELIAAQGRKRTAEQAFFAAQARLELAQRDLVEAEGQRAALALRVREKYGVSDEDQIAADGTIWRAENNG